MKRFAPKRHALAVLNIKSINRALLSVNHLSQRERKRAIWYLVFFSTWICVMKKCAREISAQLGIKIDLISYTIRDRIFCMCLYACGMILLMESKYFFSSRKHEFIDYFYLCIYTYWNQQRSAIKLILVMLLDFIEHPYSLQLFACDSNKTLTFFTSTFFNALGQRYF